MWVVVLALGGVLFLVVVSSQAAPGDLDPGFGKGGRVMTAFASAHNHAYAIALQPDGRIVAVGETERGSRFDFAVARYERNGALDRTFGVGGKTVTALGTKNAAATAVAISPDGDILAAGPTAVSHSVHDQFVLVRYARNGALDTGFGSGGTVDAPFAVDNIGVFLTARLALQSDGKILLAATTAAANSPLYHFALARYNRDGYLDASFGDGGVVTTGFGADAVVLSGVAIQPDGKIVVAGYRLDVAPQGASLGGFALARYSRDGSLDPTFGSGGLVTTTIASGGAAAAAVAVQQDGRIVAAGLAYTARDLQGAKVALARYEPDGSLDASFGAGGTVTTALGDDPSVRGIGIRSDGKIVVAGRFRDQQSMFALARYDADGALDSRFGRGGVVRTAFDIGDAEANALAIQRDGKILAAGSSEDPDAATTTFALARYLDSQAVCLVPKLTRKPLGEARRAITRAHCSLGAVRHAVSNRTRKGRVVAQQPAPGARLPAGAKVRLVVSKGSRPDRRKEGS